MLRQDQYKGLVRLVVISATAGLCSPVWSSAYQLMEQNVTNLGTAYAGTASLAIDASTGFYNSAGLTRICQEQIAISLVGIKTDGRVGVNRALDSAGQPLINPLPPANGRIKGDGLSPGIHYAYRFNDCLVFGLNVVMPFGLKTGYREDSAVRYMSTRSEIRTYDIAPSLAYSFHNGLSVGAGFDFVHGFAQADTSTTVPGVRGNPVRDGFREDKAENWGLGGHLGFLYEFDDCTRVGFNYRSEVKINARGETLIQPLATLAINRFDLKVNTRLPATAVISAFHQFENCWALMADIQWTQWNVHKEFVFQNIDGSRSFSQSIRSNFKNTMRYALGTHYQMNDCWLFRFGVAYDQSPVRDELRNTRIPDSNRSWLALGARYSINQCLNIDLGYAHVFFRNSRLNDRASIANNTPQGRQELDGTVRSSADLLGIQLTWDLA